jgi:glycosyltransferase involved in cell wall biosynthesis
MKLLLVSPFTSTSGSAIRFWNIALQFKARGYTVVYSDRGSRSGKPLYKAEGIIYRPGRVISPLILDILLSTIFNVIMLVRHLDCGAYYALKPAPNNGIPALIAGLFGKKVVLDIDDLDFAYLAPGYKRHIYRFFFHFFPRFFPLITCHTSRLFDYCSRELHIPKDRLFFLKQGVSSEFLRIAPDNRTYRKKSILYVATLGITSDFDDLIPMLGRICLAHPDATVTIAGDGERRPLFEQTIRQRKLDRVVFFIGQVDHDALPEIMAAHYIGINYMRRTEVNDCRAILKIREYLACGLHVVCNNAGDAVEFAEVANVERDLEGMERRIDHLLNQPAVRNCAGRSFVETRYTWDTIFLDFINVLEKKAILPKRNLN